MVEQLQKQEKRFVKSLRKKKTLSLLQVMAHFLLVLILGTSIISCSPLPLSLGCEFSNRLVEDSDKLKIKLWSDYLMCRITSAINPDKTLPTDTLQKD